MTPDQIGDYAVLDRIGAGAHATVHAAIDTTLGTRAALKILREPLADRDTWQRCTDELSSLTRLRSHPNVVTTLSAGVFTNELGERHAYIAMERLAESLADAIRRGPLGLEHVLQIGLGISAALAGAHAAEILHRDVKPSNILLRDAYDPSEQPVPKLADFGIARLHPTGRTQNAPATPEFAAPEVRAGEPSSPQSDIYGLAVTLVTTATGRVPVTTPSAAELPAGYPPALGSLLRSCLAVRPAQRPPTTLAAAQALTEIQEAAGFEPANIDIALQRQERDQVTDPGIAAPTRTSRARPPAPPLRDEELLFQGTQSPRSARTPWVITGVTVLIAVGIAATALFLTQRSGPVGADSAAAAPTARADGVEAPAVNDVRRLSSGGFAFTWTDPNTDENQSITYLAGFQILRDGTADSVELIPFDADAGGRPVDEQVVTDYPDRSGGTGDVVDDDHIYCVIVRLQPVLIDGDDVEPALPVDSERKCLNSTT